ncbi:MAG: hypothetical protein J0M12_10680 [Deltaproteobacteria bacterium]|nr:hypothetical protein [Deltaproteobacteria bacterium]
MLKQLSKLVLAAALMAAFTSPVMAEDPSATIQRLESLQARYATIPAKEMGKTVAERTSLISELDRELEDILANVDYEKISSLEQNQQQYFQKLTERINAAITMFKTQDDLSAPFRL